MPQRSVYILTAALVGYALEIPFVVEVVRNLPHRPFSLWVLMVLASMLLIPAGLLVTRTLGVEATPILDAYLVGESARAGVWKVVRVALISMPIVLIADQLTGLLFRRPPTITLTANLANPKSLVLLQLAAIGAGPYEESVYRLGLLSCIVWLFARGLKLGAEDHTTFWLANLAQATCFSFLHQILAPLKPLSFRMAVPTSYTGAALVFGYVYWIYGWEAAVLSHVLFDSIAPIAVVLIGGSRWAIFHLGARN